MGSRPIMEEVIQEEWAGFLEQAPIAAILPGSAFSRLHLNGQPQEPQCTGSPDGRAAATLRVVRGGR